MSVHKKNCPVPFDQQPLNEYKELKKSPLFESSTTELSVFLTRLIFIFSAGITLGLAVTLLSINPSKISLSSIISNVLFSLFSIEILLIRLYLGWSYVLKRLSSATVFYEESGWYDGQIWVKTAESLMQDRLIGFYEVLPFIQRIKYSLFSSLIFFIADTILCYLL